MLIKVLILYPDKNCVVVLCLDYNHVWHIIYVNLRRLLIFKSRMYMILIYFCLICVINCASLYIIASYSAKLLVLHIKSLQFLLNLRNIIEFNEMIHILSELECKKAD